MQKIIRFVRVATLAVVFGTQLVCAQAPTEAMAGMPEDGLLTETPSLASPPTVETAKAEKPGNESE